MIAVEFTSLAILSRHQPGVVAKNAAPPRSLFAPGTCNAIVFDTYWKVVHYIKDVDHPPASLNDLVPKYLDKLPSDPVTGEPLEYSSDGSRFNLNCPGARPARR